MLTVTIYLNNVFVSCHSAMKITKEVQILLDVGPRKYYNL